MQAINQCKIKKNIALVFNGEIYNYRELYRFFPDYKFNSNSDSELILAAYEKWGEDCLDYFTGMFAFAIWDEDNQKLFCARDRFGVKPFYYANQNGNFYFSSEIKALHAAGLKKSFNESIWASYFGYGLYEHCEQTFYEKINNLPPGNKLILDHKGLRVKPWYSLKSKLKLDYDNRSEKNIKSDYIELLRQSIELRFRSDVPVGVNLSGGLDSSILFALINEYLEEESKITAFTFATGNADYDEIKWASYLLKNTHHNHEICYLRVEEIPDLALEIQESQDEPFGGFPTLAYSKIFKRAKEIGIRVLLDGQGMDEQWAGYEYYKRLVNIKYSEIPEIAFGPVQSSKNERQVKNYLNRDFISMSKILKNPTIFTDALRNIQYRDTFYTKIPRALRFNDRISMKYSIELREPFLDHNLFEFSFQQKSTFKIRSNVQKWILRDILKDIMPRTIAQAPKRPLQTPQREWLKGPLREWVNDCIMLVVSEYGGSWFIKEELINEWNSYLKKPQDNSFYIWQLINLALMRKLL